MNHAGQLAIFAALVDWLPDFLHTMNGPDFLVLYLVSFLITFGLVLLLRRTGHDWPAVTAIGLVVFIGLGAARIIAGRAHGMQNWDFLTIMMVIGGFCFVVRVSHVGGGDSGGTSWWSSSSGCGGGGCGGGGGGCGGCGGD